MVSELVYGLVLAGITVGITLGYRALFARHTVRHLGADTVGEEIAAGEPHAAFEMPEVALSSEGTDVLYDQDAQAVITRDHVYIRQGPGMRADIPLHLIDGLAVERLSFLRWSMGKRAIYAASGRPTAVVIRLRTPLKVMTGLAHEVTSVAVEVSDPKAYLSVLAAAAGVEADPQ